ncbi:putative glycosyltransferase EpsD [bioreactor metagenome]|uniref:Putative glycosyltransferase EpsD n=1 Tax=bioreactor metagenome TaxID=1076179 RepID=A0A645BMY9_9ZZZZ
MKKILYVATLSRTINAFLIPHIEKLIEDGYEVDCACFVDQEIDKRILDKGCNIFEIPFSRNPLHVKNIKSYKKIKELYYKKKYDIVHVHTPVASFITRLALRNEKNLKMVYTCHGFHFYEGSPMINWVFFYPLEKMAAKWTDCLVTINSEDYKRANKFKLKNNGQIKKMNGVGIEKEKYVIQNFDRDKYRKSLDIDKDDFVILVLAELIKNKNHIQLIKSMNLLKDKYPNIKAVLAGNGPLEEEIKKQIKEYGLKDKISLLGWRDDIKELINLCDLVGLFSKREGLGKCLLEAMVCGKPVIATNTRGPRELIEENVNGFMFEINDIEATANSIEKLYKTSNESQQLEEKISKNANKYLLENVLSQLNSIYDMTDIDENELLGESI